MFCNDKVGGTYSYLPTFCEGLRRYIKDDEMHETYRDINIGLEICVNMERLEGHTLYVS